MDKNINKEQLAEQTEEVTGGKVIESVNGKFYVVPNNSESFSTKEDAENAEKMLKSSNMFQSHPRPLPMVIPRNNALAPIPKEFCKQGLMTTQLSKTPQNPTANLDIKPEIK